MKKVSLLCALMGAAVMFTACDKKEESKTVETEQTTTVPADAPADTVTETTTTTSTEQ